jgi:hypothetical protein
LTGAYPAKEHNVSILEQEYLEFVRQAENLKGYS